MRPLGFFVFWGLPFLPFCLLYLWILFLDQHSSEKLCALLTWHSARCPSAGKADESASGHAHTVSLKLMCQWREQASVVFGLAVQGHESWSALPNTELDLKPQRIRA